MALSFPPEQTAMQVAKRQVTRTVSVARCAFTAACGQSAGASSRCSLCYSSNSISHFGRRVFGRSLARVVRRDFSFSRNAPFDESLGVNRSIPLQSGKSRSSAFLGTTGKSEFFIKFFGAEFQNQCPPFTGLRIEPVRQEQVYQIIGILHNLPRVAVTNGVGLHSNQAV